MAESKVFLISLMIFSTHALRVLLTDGVYKGFEHETEIDLPVDEYGFKRYNGCVTNKTYTPRNATKKVIVYMKSYEAMTRTALRQKCRDVRMKITKTLREHDYELLYLAVNGFKKSDQRFIAEFLLQSINIIYFQINTIGEKSLNVEYSTAVHNLEQYVEENDIFGGQLLKEIRSMDE